MNSGDTNLPTVGLPKHMGISSNPPGATFGPRRMTDFEFVWMIEGNSRYRWGDEEFDLPEGAVVLCRPGAIDAFEWDRRRRSRHGFVHFDVGDVPPLFPAVAQWAWVRTLEEHDVWRPMFRHLMALADPARPAPAALVRLTLQHLVTSFVFGYTAAGEAPPPPMPDPVRAATAFLVDTLEIDAATPISLQDLAEAACVTPAYLCRVYKRATGRSPAEAVRLARLDRALALLTRSNESVGNIAAACGFASPFHFSRRFREAFGQSPQTLRRRVRDGQTPPLPRLHTPLRRRVPVQQTPA